MKAAIFTLGCKVNEVESEKIAALLKSAGFEIEMGLAPADIYVLNTCAVTREAEKKSRQLIARAKKFNPSAEIYICGCASQKCGEEFLDKHVDFVCGAMDKERIVEEICLRHGKSFYKNIYPLRSGTRAFVKIEDGCDNFCSYCIIPYLRGRERSRSIEDICGEIANSSAPEIVLTGINISAFNDGGKNLCDLVKALYNTEKRIRLGSLECSIISDEFLFALKGLKDFAEQFHLSLQSGSTAVLKSMNRHYTREQYLNKCRDIYSHFPDAAITTDIIAGFAGESEEEFEESLSIIKEVGFARVHAFPYSPREGTAAFKRADVPADIKKDRLKRLISEAERAEGAYIEKFFGRKLIFIAEEFDGEYTVGYTGNYIRAYVPAKLEAGKKYEVTIGARFKGGALASLI